MLSILPRSNLESFFHELTSIDKKKPRLLPGLDRLWKLVFLY